MPKDKEQRVPKRLIVSGVNLVEGGTLTVFRDFLEATRLLGEDWEVIALVHDKRLFDASWVKFQEFPSAKTSWLQRLYHEFILFRRVAADYKPNVWFSMHDISPRVNVPRQVVYCHNPSPFYQSGWKDLRWSPKFFLFTLFYRFLYGINIHANDLVVVQQVWLRQAFQNMFGVKKVAVAHPVCRPQDAMETIVKRSSDSGIFLYPALPRPFKNFEVLCNAAERLYRRVGAGFEVRLTISPEESEYANHLYRRYGKCPAVKFIGRQSPDQMQLQYIEASAVIFPSKLETWGLPISETKQLGKPLLVSDLPYAHESVGDYTLAAFFHPDDVEALTELMASILNGTYSPAPHEGIPVSTPFARDWSELVKMVVDSDSTSTVPPS